MNKVDGLEHTSNSLALKPTLRPAGHENSEEYNIKQLLDRDSDS